MDNSRDSVTLTEEQKQLLAQGVWSADDALEALHSRDFSNLLRPPQPRSPTPMRDLPAEVVPFSDYSQIITEQFPPPSKPETIPTLEEYQVIRRKMDEFGWHSLTPEEHAKFSEFEQQGFS